MAKKKVSPYFCKHCKNKDWVLDKEWNYSINEHLPLTLVCRFSGEHIVRSAHACFEHFEKNTEEDIYA